jgi:hypothetical protein
MTAHALPQPAGEPQSAPPRGWEWFESGLLLKINTNLLDMRRGSESFFFEPADPTLLGLLRVCVGCVTLYVYLTYCIDLASFVGPNAWIDERAARYLTQEIEMPPPPTGWEMKVPEKVPRGLYLASVYFHVTDPRWIWAIHLGILAGMVLFTIGYQTRITSVLAWMGALCYMDRSPMTLFGMDVMNNILLLYLMVGPSGAALSVDRWLEVRRLRLRGRRVEPPAPLPSARLALRLIQIHFCVIYLAAGTAKLQGSTWWDGTALWSCYANFVFAPMKSEWYREWLVFLSKHRPLWEVVMTASAAFTIGLEIGFPFLVWTRLRWLCVLGSILMHAGIALTMGLTSFSMLMFCMVLAFAPPEYVRPWLESFRRRLRPALTQRATPPPVAAAPALAASR